MTVCYFGKDGFSHKSSGRAGLLFDCRTANGDEVVSDSTWTCCVNPCYMECGDPDPNYRLSEASILFDARQSGKSGCSGMKDAVVIGKAGDAPWNGLVERPVPLWRFSGPTDYVEIVQKGDSLPPSDGSEHGTIISIPETRRPWKEYIRLIKDTWQDGKPMTPVW